MTGKQLRLFFKSRGISRCEIAERTGLKEGYINNLFSGADPLTASASYKFMLAFPATREFLLPQRQAPVSSQRPEVATGPGTMAPGLVPAAAEVEQEGQE